MLFYRNVLKLSRRIDLHKRSRHHVCCKLCWNIFCKETAGFQGCCSHSLHNTLSPLDSGTRITASPRQWGLPLSCRNSVKQMNQLAPKMSNSQTARLTFSSLVMRNVLQPLTWQCFKLFQKVIDSPTHPQKKEKPSIYNPKTLKFILSTYILLPRLSQLTNLLCVKFNAENITWRFPFFERLIVWQLVSVLLYWFREVTWKKNIASVKSDLYIWLFFCQVLEPTLLSLPFYLSLICSVYFLCKLRSKQAWFVTLDIACKWLNFFLPLACSVSA